MKVNISGRGRIPLIGLLAPVRNYEITLTLAQNLLRYQTFQMYESDTAILLTSSNLNKMFDPNRTTELVDGTSDQQESGQIKKEEKKVIEQCYCGTCESCINKSWNCEGRECDKCNSCKNDNDNKDSKDDTLVEDLKEEVKDETPVTPEVSKEETILEKTDGVGIPSGVEEATDNINIPTKEETGEQTPETMETFTCEFCEGPLEQDPDSEEDSLICMNVECESNKEEDDSSEEKKDEVPVNPPGPTERIPGQYKKNNKNKKGGNRSGNQQYRPTGETGGNNNNVGG